MTLHATREGENITIHATSGPVTFTITEYAGIVGHFWGHLGELLEGAEKPYTKTGQAGEPEIDAEALSHILLEGLDN